MIRLLPELGDRLGEKLRVVRNDGQVAVFAGQLPIQIFDADDRAARAAGVAMLSRLNLATDIEIGQAFGLHRNTVARLSSRYQEGGMRAVVPAKRGPRGPHKVTPAVIEVVRENRGLEILQLRRLVAERTGVQLSHGRMWQLRRECVGEQAELAMGVEAAASEETAERASAEVVALDTSAPPAVQLEAGPSEEVARDWEPPTTIVEGRAGNVGASLYFGAIEALGLLEAARTCFRLPNSELFGVRAVVLTLFYLTLLGRTTVEAAKHLRRWQFGPLIGVVRAPAVKTLRRKLAELVQQQQATRFGELLSRRWIERSLVASAYLYVDGHMKVYTGKRKLAEVWNSQRRMPLPGLLTYFVNDQQGRPLLFVTEDANGSLARVMPRMVAAIRKVLGDRRFTVIFDRGGFDGKLFTWLRQERIEFITYQRGEPKLPGECFRRRQTRFEGRQVWMQIAEDSVWVADSGPWRRIVVGTKDGHQTPILSSLGSEIKSARIACLMFARWRQENFFRYMRERQGLDQLLGYAHAEADGAQLVPNPEYGQVQRELRASRRELTALRAELGQAVLDEPREGSRSVHGLKTTQKGAVGRLRSLENVITRLLDLRRALPQQVPLAEVGRREVMRLEQKAIVDRVKITAYNAEEWLLERLLRHYDNPHDVRDLLRSLTMLDGELRRTTTGIVVILDAPDLPAHRRALRGLCLDLNQQEVTFPGTQLPVTYQVAVHRSGIAA